jgi:hypothetical protein
MACIEGGIELPLLLLCPLSIKYVSKTGAEATYIFKVAKSLYYTH